MLNMDYGLSYLMGAQDISDADLENLGVSIENRTENGSRKLKIPKERLSQYAALIKGKLSTGFWNEIITDTEIIFIFKFKNGEVLQYSLSPNNEAEIDKLCAEFNNEPANKTANVYKYISENDFYQDFMKKHYAEMINR